MYIVDFGLAKKHLNDIGIPYPERGNADFRGTVSFASLNAHLKKDLSRRDDMWSFYFVILDFLQEKLIWREEKALTMDQVRDLKKKCLQKPKKMLWLRNSNTKEIRKIFRHISSLKYEDRPDYKLIKK